MLGAFEEFEKSLIVERVNAGLKAGRQPGGGLYHHAHSSRYYTCKTQGGIRRERRMKEWLSNLEKMDAEVKKITLH